MNVNPEPNRAKPATRRRTGDKERKPSHDLVIERLCDACEEALHAIAAAWPFVDFHDGLRATAQQIEAALELAGRPPRSRLD